MMMVVKFALETMQDVIDARKASCFKGVAGIYRTVATTADQHERTIMHMTGELFDFADEVRINVPVRTVVPGHMQGACRMADEEKFHFAAAVDEQGLGIFGAKTRQLLSGSGVPWGKFSSMQNGDGNTISSTHLILTSIIFLNGVAPHLVQSRSSRPVSLRNTSSRLAGRCRDLSCGRAARWASRGAASST